MPQSLYFLTLGVATLATLLGGSCALGINCPGSALYDPATKSSSSSKTVQILRDTIHASSLPNSTTYSEGSHISYSSTLPLAQCRFSERKADLDNAQSFAPVRPTRPSFLRLLVVTMMVLPDRSVLVATSALELAAFVRSSTEVVPTHTICFYLTRFLLVFPTYFPKAHPSAWNKSDSHQRASFIRL